MIQLKILSGKKAGGSWVARRFPVRIGRSANSDLQLDDSGVWDEHLEISLNAAAGFILEAQPNALVSVNGQPVQHLLLGNGDKIEIGSLKMQFWLGEVRQRGLGLPEAVVWTIIVAVSLGQIALIYWLLP